MARLIEDQTGNVFGSLTVLGRAPNNKQGSAQSFVRCECGIEKVVKDADLRRGTTISCGCKRGSNTTHGCARKGNRRSEYGIWAGIIQRCTNAALDAYPRYGGRGITVCQRWRDSFEDFLADVGPRPSLQHSIDRYPNNDGNYEPGNVRWATAVQQRHNRRDLTEAVAA